MIRGLEHSCCEKRQRVGAVQPGEERALGTPNSSLPAPEGAYKKAAEGLFTRAYSDRCPGFSWDRVNFSPSSCCVLDLVPEECR